MIRFGAIMTLCLSGLLALSACGSGKALPAAAAGTSPAPTPTSPPAPGSSAESFHVGRYTVVFASPLPANPAQAKVIEGFREAQILWDKSENTWRLAVPVREYVTGHALTRLIDAVTYIRPRHLVFAGAERFLLTRVTGIAGGTATVTTCDDYSNFKVENRQTGATYMTTPPAQSYLFETWRMVKLSGHWGVTAYSLALPPSPRAAPCRP